MGKISFEGLSIDEILALPDIEIDGLVFDEDALVVRIGSSEVLGQFTKTENRLVLELAQIDGGGEGVLPALGALASRYAQKHNLTEIEWQVHAITCAKPNMKLRKLLVKRGFEIASLPTVGEVYHKIVTL